MMIMIRERNVHSVVGRRCDRVSEAHIHEYCVRSAAVYTQTSGRTSLTACPSIWTTASVFFLTTTTPIITLTFGGEGWIAKWVASSGRVQKSRVQFPAVQKCWAQLEFVNIYQFRFHHMLKYACVYCVRFVLINLQHCGQPWRWLVAVYRPC